MSHPRPRKSQLAAFVGAIVAAVALIAVTAGAAGSNTAITLSVGQSATIRCPNGLLSATLAASPFTATCASKGPTPPTTTPPSSTTTTIPPPSNCTPSNAVFNTAQNAGYTFPDGYIVYSDMWNDPNPPASGAGSQQVAACSAQNWIVTADMPPTGQPSTDVKTYPSVQDDFNGVPLSQFTTLTSSFAETDQHIGDYEDAYDIWLDGEAQAGSHELMIWNENNGQTPAGNNVGTFTSDGHTWTVYETSGAVYVAFVATANFTAGSYNLLNFLNYGIAKGWYSGSTVMSQINYGVEICSTNNQEETWGFTGFEVNAVSGHLVHPTGHPSLDSATAKK